MCLGSFICHFECAKMGWKFRGVGKKWQLIGDYNKITTSNSIIEIEIVRKRQEKSMPLLGDLFGSFYMNTNKLNEKYVGKGK
jgi:hypothetical protein